MFFALLNVKIVVKILFPLSNVLFQVVFGIDELLTWVFMRFDFPFLTTLADSLRQPIITNIIKKNFVMFRFASMSINFLMSLSACRVSK